MTRVAPVGLQYNPRTLWFDPGDLDIKRGDAVVVLTARGVEFGHAVADVFEADEEQLKKLKSPMKPVKRIATEEDIAHAQEMEEKGKEALPIFREMAAEDNEDMRPIAVEYLLEGDKAIFFFEAPERVDFRSLVRKLASHFHVRVDMRQIGVRDEARMVGGYGHCGQELCCKRLGDGFCPVSIRMAKEQDLSLNPQKISGVCGRLMCCLRYEFEAYKDFNSRAPKKGSAIKTPDGQAKVVDLDPLREVVSVCIEGEKPLKVPLADMEIEKGAARPNKIGKDAWQRAGEQDFISVNTTSTYATSLFTGNDKLASAGSVRHTASSGLDLSGVMKDIKEQQNKAKKSSKKQSKAYTSDSQARKPRKRRSTKLGADEQDMPRPGQKSSALRQNRQNGAQGKQASGKQTQGQGKHAQNQGKHAQGQGGNTQNRSKNTQGQSSSGEHRRSRRRSHKTSGN